MHYKYNIKVKEGTMIMNFICIKNKGKEMMQWREKSIQYLTITYRYYESVWPLSQSRFIEMITILILTYTVLINSPEPGYVTFFRHRLSADACLAL